MTIVLLALFRRIAVGIGSPCGHFAFEDWIGLKGTSLALVIMIGLLRIVCRSAKLFCEQSARNGRGHRRIWRNLSVLSRIEFLTFDDCDVTLRGNPTLRRFPAQKPDKH
jgi:hypothetical protein